tara:strand:- start:1671 stop:2435 length:765 start_codon:yes stop_codon:yes gene_type:complete
MASGETEYTYRQTGPDVLQRARANTVALEVWHNGAKVAPSVATVSLVRPSGTFVIEDAAASIVSDVATYTISAGSLPTTEETGRLYQLRWTLTIGGLARTLNRACTVARFPMVLPVTDLDLTEGEYPDLVDQLGDYGSNLQTFLSAAKRDVLRELEQMGQWPDVITGPSDLYEPIRQAAFAKIFRFLFSTNDSERSERLMELHRAEYASVMKTLRVRVDRDGDGVPDTEARESASRTIHRGGAVSRYRRRSALW